MGESIMGSTFEVKNTGEVKLKLFSADPGSPVEGQIIYNSTDKKLRFYDGTQWKNAGGADFGAGSADLASKYNFLPNAMTFGAGNTTTPTYNQTTRFWNNAFAWFSHGSGGSTSMGGTMSGSTVVAIIAEYTSQNGKQGTYMVYGAKAADVAWTTNLQTNGSSISWIQEGMLFLPSGTPSAVSFTDNGNKYIPSGGNPVTDWAGAAAFTNQADSAVKKITLPASTYDGVAVMAVHSLGGSNSLMGQAYLWNFSNNTWVAMTEWNGDGGFGRQVHGVIMGKASKFVNGSNELYIRYQTTGTAPTSTLGTPVIYRGGMNPLD